MSDPADRQHHWEQVYREKAEDAVSWYQAHPQVSLQLIRACTRPGDALIDVGGGASRLVDHLLAEGFTDLTVLDIAAAALERARARLGKAAAKVRWLTADIIQWHPERRYALWHDRAVFHFMTEARDRAAYAARLRESLAPGGHAVIASFALDGPERCSGLPVRRYSPDSLAAEMGVGFRLLESRMEEHLTPMGRSQRFQYSLLRFQP
ncbi:MAG TPA: methyltransferase [Gammaproteobacteria bacterium]|nr:methyltransferase [Gammaproteobacteria bacterium]